MNKWVYLKTHLRLSFLTVCVKKGCCSMNKTLSAYIKQCDTETLFELLGQIESELEKRKEKEK